MTDQTNEDRTLVIDLAEDQTLSSLFEGSDLSEETRSRMETIFEAAVSEKVSEIETELTERLAEESAELINSMLEEEIEDLIEQLDAYLTRATREWFKENELAVESGIKVEMAENFMEDLKSLMETHNLDFDPSTESAVSELEERLQAANDVMNDMLSENKDLQNEILKVKLENIIEDKTSEMSRTEKKRFYTLIENVDLGEDLEAYSEKLEDIREHFFSSRSAAVFELSEDLDFDTDTEISFEASSLNEDVDPQMAAVLQAIRKTSQK